VTGAGTFSLPASHPMFAGHFPGNPIVPGAYLIALVEQRANDWLRKQGATTQVNGVSAVKFLRPVRPDELCEIEFGAPTGDRLRFQLQVAGTPCAGGTFTLQPRAGSNG
jgi:3-hydroxymyristoyl/3-hydroxydecanoyl-(acyl carrier protein) dehydratase